MVFVCFLFLVLASAMSEFDASAFGMQSLLSICMLNVKIDGKHVNRNFVVGRANIGFFSSEK